MYIVPKYYSSLFATFFSAANPIGPLARCIAVRVFPFPLSTSRCPWRGLFSSRRLSGDIHQKSPSRGLHSIQSCQPVDTSCLLRYQEIRLTVLGRIWVQSPSAKGTERPTATRPVMESGCDSIAPNASPAPIFIFYPHGCAAISRCGEH